MAVPPVSGPWVTLRNPRFGADSGVKVSVAVIMDVLLGIGLDVTDCVGRNVIVIVGVSLGDGLSLEADVSDSVGVELGDGL
jgi:hypothetical protein